MFWYAAIKGLAITFLKEWRQTYWSEALNGSKIVSFLPIWTNSKPLFVGGGLSPTDLPLYNFLLWSNWNSFPPSTFVSFLLFSLPSQPAAVIVCRCVLLKVFRQPHYSNCPAVTPPFTITSSCELWTRKHNHQGHEKELTLETYWMHFFFFPSANIYPVIMCDN